MTRTWIHSGKVADPFNEFFVKERKGFRDTMSSKSGFDRYALLADQVPELFKDVSEKIFETGKYVAVLAEFQQVKESFSKADITFESMDLFKQEVFDQYDSASKSVIAVFKEKGLETFYQDVIRKYLLFEFEYGFFFELCSELRFPYPLMDKDRVRRTFDSLVTKDIKVDFWDQCVFHVLERISSIKMDNEYPDFSSVKGEDSNQNGNY